MKKGEIWLVELKKAGGREQFGLRPCIILADTNTNLVLIIPVTSNLNALRFSYTLLIKGTKLNNLKSDSVALLFQLTAADKIKVKSKIGQVEESILKRINEILTKLLQL